MVGILIVGLLIATMLPVGSSTAQPTDEKHINKLASQIEIGSMIFPGYTNREATMNLGAGKTTILIIPVRGFGATNIELTVDTTMETASGMVFGRIVFGV